MGYVQYPTDKKVAGGSRKKSWLSYPYFHTILFATLAGLKIGGVLHWSWWLVAAPMWVPITMFVVMGVMVGVALSLVVMIRYIREAM